jgi:hypothetical protein
MVQNPLLAVQRYASWSVGPVGAAGSGCYDLVMQKSSNLINLVKGK